MSLSSISFLGVYFPAILIAYYNPLIKSNTFRKVILLCASLGLYTFCEPIYVLLLVFIILSNYLLVKLADRFNSKLFRGSAIALDAGILLFFKYINKVIAVGLFHPGLSSFAFPIGLSYFSFKAISYVVDSKDSKDGNLFDVAIYISNFLTIVSGPLSTYHDELISIKEKKSISTEKLYRGFERIIIGLAKKVIIADSLSSLVTNSFSSNELSVLMAWAGAIAYTLQLFFDFSGYTDMAIGVGYLFGFDLPENFNYPYMADSISDFWKRWHMSLTKWFTKYIYISLGGSRVKSVSRHILNLFAVWAVTGMWHGSSLTFIVWAMVYFLLQLLEKYTDWAQTLKKYHIGHVYTLLIVVLEWVIFRADSFCGGLHYLKALFKLNGNEFISLTDGDSICKYVVPLVLGIIFSTNIGVKIKKAVNDNDVFNGVYNGVLIAVFVVCIVILISLGYSSPLYAGF